MECNLSLLCFEFAQFLHSKESILQQFHSPCLVGKPVPSQNHQCGHIAIQAKPRRLLKMRCNPKFQVLEFDRCFTFANYKLQTLCPRLQCRKFQCSQSNVGSNSASEPRPSAKGGQQASHETCKDRTGNCWSLGLDGHMELVQRCNPHVKTNLAVHLVCEQLAVLHVFFHKVGNHHRIRAACQELRQRHSLCSSEMKSKRRSELLLHLSPMAVSEKNAFERPFRLVIPSWAFASLEFVLLKWFNSVVSPKESLQSLSTTQPGDLTGPGLIS